MIEAPHAMRDASGACQIRRLGGATAALHDSAAGVGKPRPVIVSCIRWPTGLLRAPACNALRLGLAVLRDPPRAVGVVSFHPVRIPCGVSVPGVHHAEAPRLAGVLGALLLAHADLVCIATTLATEP